MASAQCSFVMLSVNDSESMSLTWNALVFFFIRALPHPLNCLSTRALALVQLPPCLIDLKKVDSLKESRIPMIGVECSSVLSNREQKKSLRGLRPYEMPKMNLLQVTRQKNYNL